MNIQTIINFIESTGIIIASLTATLGLYTWRKEARWKKKNELAEEVLYNLYDARDRFRTIRHPFAHPSEGETRPSTKQESPEEKSLRNYAYTTIERYNKNSEPFLNLEKLKYRFAIYFGEENASSISNLLSLKNEVLSASYKYANYSIEHNKKVRMNMNEIYIENQIQQLNKQLEIFASIIWENYADEDSINIRLNTIIKNLENVLNKYIN